MAQRAVAVAAVVGMTALALAACAGGSGTTNAAAAAQQQLIDSGAFIDVNIAKSTEKNSNGIFAWVKVDAEMTADQLATVVKALGDATTDAGNCALEIVGEANDTSGSRVYLRPAAAELGLTEYLVNRDYRLEMTCRDAQEFVR